MQKHKVLINSIFTGTTSNSLSELVFLNGYQVNVQSLGGGVVNETNVRAFLEDSRNSFIITDFFSFLTGSTNILEFRAIYYNDTKLSEVFNEYYNTSVLSGVQTSTYIIDSNLSGSVQTNYYDNNFNWDGISPASPMSGTPLSVMHQTRPNILKSELSTYSIEDSYYINVFINKNFNETSRLRYDDLFPEILNKLLLSSYTDSNLSNSVTGTTFNDTLVLNSAYINSIIHD